MYLNAGYKACFVITIDKPESAIAKKTSKPPNWHSVRDSWERINDKTLRDSIGMAIEFCKIVDEEPGSSRSERAAFPDEL